MTQLEKNKEGKMLDLNFKLQPQKSCFGKNTEEWQCSSQTQLSHQL